MVCIAIGCCWGGARRHTTFRRYDAAQGAGVYDGNQMRYVTATTDATSRPYTYPQMGQPTMMQMPPDPVSQKQQLSQSTQPNPYDNLPTVRANPIHAPSSE